MYPYNIEPQSEAMENYQAMDVSVNKVKTDVQSKPYPQHHPLEPKPKHYPVKPDERLLKMIETGIKDEVRMSDYYARLMKMFRDPTDVELIRHMRMDSIKHVKILEKLYNNVAEGKSVIKTMQADNEQPIQVMNNICDNLSRDILDTINSCEYYRKLYVTFLNVEVRDMLYEIVCDKHSHATKLTFLFAKHK